jgi:DNA repair/transcription protein MET18/MMS19
VANYEPIDTSLVPYVTNLWSSLKYEVRNGEVPEAIQETLHIFEYLTSRLAKFDSTEAALADFLSLTWNDTAEDLENPTYTEQAGLILTSIAGGSVLAFCCTNPRFLEAVRRNISQPKSAAHTRILLILLNNLIRTHGKLTAKVDEWSECEKRAFNGDVFGIPVTVIEDIYFKLLREHATENPSKEQAEIAKEAVMGLSLLVELQRLRSDFTTTAAYEEDTLREICTALSDRATNAFNSSSTASTYSYNINISTVAALKTVVRVFPEGYAKMLSDLVSEVEKRDWQRAPSEHTFGDLHSVCQRIAYIGCADVPKSANPIVNFALFAGTMLNILSVLFNAEANIKFCAVVADALATGMAYFTKAAEEKGLKQQDTVVETHKIGDLEHMLHAEIPDFPKLRCKQVNLYDPIPSAKSVKAAKHSVFASFQVVGVYVVSELYQHATSLSMPADSEIPLLQLSDALRSAQNMDKHGLRVSDDLAAYLSELGRAACLVLRELSPTAQTNLEIDSKVLSCFNNIHRRISDRPLVILRDMELYALSCGIAEAMHSSTVMIMVSGNPSTLYSPPRFMTCSS